MTAGTEITVELHRPETLEALAAATTQVLAGGFRRHGVCRGCPSYRELLLMHAGGPDRYCRECLATYFGTTFD